MFRSRYQAKSETFCRRRVVLRDVAHQPFQVVQRAFLEVDSEIHRRIKARTSLADLPSSGEELASRIATVNSCSKAASSPEPLRNEP